MNKFSRKPANKQKLKISIEHIFNIERKGGRRGCRDFKSKLMAVEILIEFHADNFFFCE